MNDSERDDLEVLAGARRALSPSAHDGERVLAATLHAVHAPAASDAASELSADAASSSTAALLGGSARVWQFAVALSIAGASGAVGYGFGRRAGVEDAQREVPPVQVEAMVNGPALEPLATAVQDAAVMPPGVEAVAPEPEAQPLGARRRAVADARAAGRSAPEPVTAPSLAHSLELEIRALKRVERALREHEPRRALELLGELDRTVPSGKLEEERFAAFVMARCALGLGKPELVVREFEQRYGQSVYFARVRQACAAKDDGAADP
jgi:hypothetical protein